MGATENDEPRTAAAGPARGALYPRLRSSPRSRTSAVTGVRGFGVIRVPTTVLVLLAGLIGIAACFAVSGNVALGAMTYVGVEFGAVVVILGGWPLRRNRRSAAWILIGLGMAWVCAGDAAWYAFGASDRHVPSPSAFDIAYLLEYPFLIAGAALLVRGRPDRGMVLDALIVCVAAGVAIWEIIVVPGLADPTQSDATTLVNAAYPIADLALIGVMSGIFFSTGLPTPSVRLLVAGFALIFVADVLYLWLSVAGDVPDPSALDLGWLGALVLIAAAAVHPSAGSQIVVRPGASRRRIVANVPLLTAASLAVPMTLGLLSMTGDHVATIFV